MCERWIWNTLTFIPKSHDIWTVFLPCKINNSKVFCIGYGRINPMVFIFSSCYTQFFGGFLICSLCNKFLSQELEKSQNSSENRRTIVTAGISISKLNKQHFIWEVLSMKLRNNSLNLLVCHLWMYVYYIF